MSEEQSQKRFPWPEMGQLSRSPSLWGLPLWAAVPLVAVMLPAGARTIGLLLLPITLVAAWFSKRSGLPPRWLWGIVAAGLPLSASIAMAADADPCESEDPPAWCEEYKPPVRTYPEGTLQPDLGAPAEPAARSGPPMFLVGTTVVQPPPVLWLNGRPENAARLYGTAQVAESFVQALELILPAGWTIWTAEDPATLSRAVGGAVLWDGNGREWPDIVEGLAQQYGVEITADTDERRVVVGLAAHRRVAAQMPVANEAGAAKDTTVAADIRHAQEASPRGAKEPKTVEEGDTVEEAPVAAGEGEVAELKAEAEPDVLASGQAESSVAEHADEAAGRVAVSVSKEEHPLYEEFVKPTQLSAEPLPDTIDQVAWRFVPAGVQVDLAALGVYVNAPVFQWDLTGSLVSPQAALKALMPPGYCLDESAFPIVRAASCVANVVEAASEAQGEEDGDVAR